MFDSEVLARVHAAIQRAVIYRRQQFRPTDEDPGLLLEHRIVGDRRREAIDLGDGWWWVGAVLDETTDPPQALAVHWHPDTERVRVDRPVKGPKMPDKPAPKLMAERNPFIR